MNSFDDSASITEQVKSAYAEKRGLRIVAGGSKNFYGNETYGDDLNIRKHSGIIEYQPSELVVTVRSGTRLSELEDELKSNGQMLAFEPPRHSEHTTIGGVIACGLSGPRRLACGSARDFVLGATIINGRAETCHFGGQVMKNVAGYDAARLMVGAQGTLGVLLDISLKILPINETERSIKIRTDLASATGTIGEWVKQGIPITASCFHSDTLYLRLSSTRSALEQSLDTIKQSSDIEEIDNRFWLSIKNQTHDFFRQSDLWRCSHQVATEFYGDTDRQLLEWNGALRWHHSPEDLYEIADRHGGHAQRYPLDNDERQKDIFQPLKPGLFRIHQHLKKAFDPHHILNRGRIYSDL